MVMTAVQDKISFAIECKIFTDNDRLLWKNSAALSYQNMMPMTAIINHEIDYQRAQQQCPRSLNTSFGQIKSFSFGELSEFRFRTLLTK